jgi:hypothetical protein
MAVLDQHCPDTLEEALLTPGLNVPMPRAVIAALLGPLIPLAAGAQAQEDAVQHPPQVHPPMPLGFGRVVFVQHRLHYGLHVVWNLPDGGHRFRVGLWLVHGHPPLREEGDRQEPSFARTVI